jgi:DHA2 family multidrug resistance protein
LIVRGLGLGFLFIPITISAFSTLKGPEIAQASALMNLMRQLGGSFGIAALATYLTNQTSVHWHQLASHLYVGNPLLDQRIQGIAGALVTKGYSLPQAKLAALRVISGTVQVQSATMAFNDAFQLIGIFALAVSPVVFLLRPGKTVAGAAEVH